MIWQARAGAKETQSRYVLMAHDWCHVNFSKHQSKFDNTQMSYDLGVGYALQASLLVDADTGKRIAPAGLNLLTEKEFFSAGLKTFNRNKAIWTHCLIAFNGKNNWVFISL